MDSGGLSDFLKQIPTGFILIFWGRGFFLVVRRGGFFGGRFRRGTPVPLVFPPMPAAYPAVSTDGSASADLPDLDVLADAQVFKPAAPPRPAGTFSLNLAEG